jgi:hypothetical protein
MLYPILAIGAIGLGAYLYEKNKAPHPQRPDAKPPAPGTQQMGVAPQPLPAYQNAPSTIQVAQRNLSKFFSTLDGTVADKYGPDPSGGKVRQYFSQADATGAYDAKTKNAVMKYQQWADDNQWGGKGVIHVPDARGNWREYGDLDPVTMNALTQWTAKNP